MLTSERLYTLRELAELWFQEKAKSAYFTVRRWFLDEPDVINAGNGTRHERILVPESVAIRVYQRRTKRGKRR